VNRRMLSSRVLRVSENNSRDYEMNTAEETVWIGVLENRGV
jgi:hypothetical protein